LTRNTAISAYSVKFHVRGQNRVDALAEFIPCLR
jgi:hypothetical protein